MKNLIGKLCVVKNNQSIFGKIKQAEKDEIGRIVVRLDIIKGNTPITDYFLDELEIKEFEIRIDLTNDTYNNDRFWCVLECGLDGIWSNVGSGWSVSAEQAFKDAFDFYNSNILKS
jgi:hypothetical protein